MGENMDNTKNNETPEKTFTQAEVDEIIKTRLARVKDSNAASEEELKKRVADALAKATGEKEKELAAREQKLVCKQFLIEEGYPVELLDAIPTTDAEQFKRSAETIIRATRARYAAPLGSPEPTITGKASPVDAAFSRKNKHTPKAFPYRNDE